MARRECRKPSSLSTARHLLLSSLIERRGGRTPTDAGHQPPRLRTARAQQSAHACRRSTAALTSGNYSIPKARLQARLPGTRSERALPAFACPSPGSTSHPGHHAGRLIPKPPESGLQIRPRAPHPLHLTACLRKASLGERDFRASNPSRDHCQELVSFILTLYDYVREYPVDTTSLK